MKHLFLTLALILSFALPVAPAPKAPACYVTGNARKQACICGTVAVPMLFCKAVRR